MTFFPCEKHQRFVVRPNEAWRKETLLPSVSVKHYNKRNPAKARRGLQRNKQEERIRKELRKAVPIKMEQDDWEDFNIATNCHICEKPQVIECFLDSMSVYDPNTEEYCQQAHKRCHFKDKFIRSKFQPKPLDKVDKWIKDNQEDCPYCSKRCIALTTETP